MLIRQMMPAAGVIAAMLCLAGEAGACEFYEAIDSRTELFDKPDAGAGLAVAILPEATQACVMEEHSDGAGNTWHRLEFYTVANVKYNVDGWVKAPSGAPPAPDGTSVAAVTAATPESARGEASAPEPSAKAAFFSHGWSLDKARSRLNFVTIKKGTVVETHQFGDLTGSVTPGGEAEVKIRLESVSTGIDIRDVRMRFLLFDVEQFPEATITAKFDPAQIDSLFDNAQISYELPVTLSIHGVSKELMVPVVISKLGDGLVAVSSAKPVTVSTADFNMQDGLQKLSEAAGDIPITPSSPVTFELAFVPAS
ncbi:YceI family protein [Jiella endophytica]|uniref:YceI family protein n=1 Tax=Jiella endophytica TaxID=2558362 RepID=A0A4Y8RCI5_9HYPH|nr:YceI family protein [Jiella endophytica]TFF18699.1 YceI family protein [Jiella endophytica]